MNATYKLKVHYYNDDDETVTGTFTVNNADSGVTKATVNAFRTAYHNMYQTRSVDTVELIKTDTTEIYPGTN